MQVNNDRSRDYTLPNTPVVNSQPPILGQQPGSMMPPAHQYSGAYAATPAQPMMSQPSASWGSGIPGPGPQSMPMQMHQHHYPYVSHAGAMPPHMGAGMMQAPGQNGPGLLQTPGQNGPGLMQARSQNGPGMMQAPGQNGLLQVPTRPPQ